MTATFPAVLIETGTFTEHDGIWISYVGEDGDVVALGHHDPDRAFAAFKDFDSDLSVEPDIGWAVLVDPPTGETASWWMQYTATQDTPGAFPVMVVEA